MAAAGLGLVRRARIALPFLRHWCEPQAIAVNRQLLFPNRRCRRARQRSHGRCARTRCSTVLEEVGMQATGPRRPRRPWRRAAFVSPLQSTATTAGAEAVCSVNVADAAPAVVEYRASADIGTADAEGLRARLRSTAKQQLRPLRSAGVGLSVRQVLDVLPLTNCLCRSLRTSSFDMVVDRHASPATSPVPT